MRKEYHPIKIKSEMDLFLNYILLAQVHSDLAKGKKELINHNSYLLKFINCNIDDRKLLYDNKNFYIYKAISLMPALVSYSIDITMDKTDYCRGIVFFNTPYGQVSFHGVNIDTNMTKKPGRWNGVIGGSRSVCHRIINRLSSYDDFWNLYEE